MSHYEDATPTWTGLTHIYLGVLDNPALPYEAHKEARKALLHVAHLADQYVARITAETSAQVK